jgi:peroxiredoxin
MALISLITLLFGAAWTWYTRPTPGSTYAGQIPSPHPGFAAPDLVVQGEQGETIRLSDLRGQAVLLNFWASWCKPCQAEMPAMQDIYAQYSSQGFTILAVNGAFQDNPNAARAFAQKLGLTFPLAYDHSGEAAHLYQVMAWPTSFFIDERGIIQEIVVGGPMAEALLAVRVRQLLELPTAGGE